jgi:hypothetical protein
VDKNCGMEISKSFTHVLYFVYCKLLFVRYWCFFLLAVKYVPDPASPTAGGAAAAAAGGKFLFFKISKLKLRLGRGGRS